MAVRESAFDLVVTLVDATAAITPVIFVALPRHPSDVAVPPKRLHEALHLPRQLGEKGTFQPE